MTVWTEKGCVWIEEGVINDWRRGSLSVCVDWEGDGWIEEGSMTAVLMDE